MSTQPFFVALNFFLIFISARVSGYYWSWQRLPFALRRSTVTPSSHMLRRCDPSLQLATTDNPAFSVSLTIGDDRGFQQYRQGDPFFSPQSFLLAHPPGPYTCLRTVKNRSIAMLSFHLKRLRESAEATSMEDSVRQEGHHSLEKRTVDAISTTMEAFLSANAPRDQACPECMVTVLYVHQAGDGYVENICPGSPQPLKILAHAWPLSPTAPEYEGPGVEVLVAGSRRFRPEAKHSSWLRDREHLDKLKVKAGAKEVVLWEVETSREGIERRVLLEGLTSNVFVVEDGTLHTATTGILQGGMRQLCIESCTEEGVSVSLEPPEVSRAQWWQAAFLTGTGRILEPISAFLFDEDVASAMLGSKRQISSTVIHREPLTAREKGVSTNGVDKSPDYGGSNIASPPLWRVKLMGDEQGKSLVRLVRRNMVSALESSATRLL